MDPTNTAFYFITDKMIELQEFFLGFASKLAYAVLLVAVLTAAVNYGLTGTGLKENIIKIGKALAFFSIVIFAYPNIVSWITEMTFSMAREAAFTDRYRNALKSNIDEMKNAAEEQRLNNERGTDSAAALSFYEDTFKKMINKRTFTGGGGKSYSYSTVAPSAALEAVFLIAKSLFQFAEGQSAIFNLPKIIKALICAFFVIVVGIFCVLEYLIAFIEFMFVSSVGIILFPLSLWEGTKFMAEKYVGAMLGFFMKLLFCNICIFLMLYLFITLSNQFTDHRFLAEVEQIIVIAFSSLLIFYICKSAPALAQSLLSGVPSLSAAGAVGTAASMFGAVARLSSLGDSNNMGRSLAGAVLGPPAPAAPASGGQGGASIASVTPPPFSASGAAGFISPPPAQQRPALEDRSDLTRSLTYNNRPLIEGGSGGAAAMLPEPGRYLPDNSVRPALPFGGRARPNGKEGAADPDVTYELLG
jgi:type IV secretory pathway TrbL component